MGSMTLGDVAVRVVMTTLFWAGAWIVAGDTLEMAVMGERTTGTVTGYWEREPLIPTGTESETVLEPRVRLASGRAKRSCHVVYRGFLHDKKLPEHGASFPVMFRPETHENCVAAATVFANWKFAAGGLLAGVGLIVAFTSFARFVVPW